MGDGSGCTYRLLETSKAVNASCMYEVYDKAVEAYNPTCFSACPQPHNVTSDCYLECYSKTTWTASEAQLLQPWHNAFNGACPLVHDWRERTRIVDPKLSFSA